MLSEVLAAVLGAMATAVFTPLGPILLERMPWKPQPYKDIHGRWVCRWTTEGEEGEIIDTVEITSVVGEKVTAVGRSTTSGDYRISGRFSPYFVLMLTYSGSEKRSLLGGVIILELNARRDKMHGHWWEYTDKKEFIGGATCWEKAS